MSKLTNAMGHFKTINQHKITVTKLCFRCGLYKQGLLHDLSKYSWKEFQTGVNFYQGNRSPNSFERGIKGYSEAWLHHKGRNRHHFEYWIDCVDGKWQGCKMPVNYVCEMFCDRVAASMTYQKEKYNDSSAIGYFRSHEHEYVMMHPDTFHLIEHLLLYLEENGLEKTIEYIRNVVLVKGY